MLLILGSLGFPWVQLGLLGFTWVHFGLLLFIGLFLVDVGDLGCMVLNLENESNVHTHKHTDRGFLGCLEILSDLIIGCTFFAISNSEYLVRNPIKAA